MSECENILDLFSNNSLRNSYCRLCLKSNNIELFCILKNTINDKNIIDILQILLSLNLPHFDGYPEVICKECLDKAVTVSEFKLRCEKSNAVLKKCYDALYKKIKEDNRKQERNDTMDYHDASYNLETLYHEEKSFTGLQSLQEHSTTFLHELQCKICKKIRKSKKSLKKHYEKHKRNKEIICPYCDGPIKNNTHCNDFKFVCHYCDFKYPCKYFLQEHISSDHTDGVVLKKTFDNVFVIRDDLTENKCQECNRTFKTSRHLNLHIAANNCKYVCDYCQIEYRFKDQLKLHIMTKHINYKPYSCNVCHKTFALKTILKSHSVVHTKERKFQCDFCGKSFVCNVTLRYHRRLHTGERPYRCKICNEGFVNTSRLRDHEQVKHIGKVQCPVCLSLFTKRSTLKQHMDKLHPKTYVKGEKYYMFDMTER